jgi:hypothetical protein
MHCEEKERLLDTYLAALGAYYDARTFDPVRWLRRGPGLERQHATRCDYWWHLEQCGCRTPRGADLDSYSGELPATKQFEAA